MRRRSDGAPTRRLKTTAQRARRWIAEVLPHWLEIIVARDNGELELAVRAPRGSRAGHLVVFTWKGQLWVRLSAPNACYPVDGAAELRHVVGQLQKDKVVFAVTYSGGAWAGTTLLPWRRAPELAPGESAHLISWSGRRDSVVKAASRRRSKQ
jgi:hypothetical protein